MTPPLIEKSEVLRYLGYRGQAIDERLDRLIDDAIADCLALARPKHVLRLFDFTRTPEGILLTGTNVRLSGGDIAASLEGASRLALLAATLGVEVENRIRVLSSTDLTASLALDAAATDCIEKQCDDACEELSARAVEQGLYPGPRFSPGYGDLPLALQPDFLQLLDAGRRIGLTCTDRLILLPRKSVTAVIGLFPAPRKPARKNCEQCSLRDTCAYRRDDGTGCPQNSPADHSSSQF